MPRYLPSAFKHGVSERDIECALASPLECRPFTTRRGRRGLSLLGSSTRGITIEVIGEYDHVTGDLVVFHAQKASEGIVRRYMGGRH